MLRDVEPSEDGVELSFECPATIDGRRFEFRAIAFDGENRKLTATHNDGQLTGNRAEFKYRFKAGPGQIRKFVIQSSEHLYSVKFENVALHPGQKTDVRAKVDLPKNRNDSGNQPFGSE